MFPDFNNVYTINILVALTSVENDFNSVTVVPFSSKFIILFKGSYFYSSDQVLPLALLETGAMKNISIGTKFTSGNL